MVYSHLFADITSAHVILLPFLIAIVNIARVEMADVNQRFFSSVRSGNISEMKKMLLQGADIDFIQDKRSALVFAAEAGDEKVVKFLMEKGAKIDLKNNDGESALMRAIYYNNVEVVEQLLEHGAQPNQTNKEGMTALVYACSNFLNKTTKRKQMSIVKLLLKHGAQINFDGQSALLHTATEGNYEIMEILLKHGAQVNMQNNEGRSALTFARVQSTVQLLLDHGAQVDLQDNDGNSALMHACKVDSFTSESTACAQALLEGGAQVNLQNKNGWSALMIATQTANDKRSALVHASGRGHIEVAQLLLKYGAYLDLQDNEGYTPLMVACFNGCKEMTSFLIDSGARIYLKNNYKKTAYDLALEKVYTDILELLRTNSSFPGIFFSEDARKELLTSSAKHIDLEDVGISLSIPEDALPSTDPPLEVQILPCISGSWEVPENLELVSPAYIVEPSREVVFRKEVLVKIWHHANLESEEDCKDMVFLSASTTPEYRDGRPVYMFQEITGVKGSFRPREKLPVAEIALKHFCILGIFRIIRYFFQCK